MLQSVSNFLFLFAYTHHTVPWPEISLCLTLSHAPHSLTALSILSLYSLAKRVFTTQGTHFWYPSYVFPLYACVFVEFILLTLPVQVDISFSNREI